MQLKMIMKQKIERDNAGIIVDAACNCEIVPSLCQWSESKIIIIIVAMINLKYGKTKMMKIW